MSYLKTLAKFEELVDKAETMVALKYGISREIIRRKNRSSLSTQARFAVWYILLDIYKATSVMVGKEYGYDHTTILNGVDRAYHLNIPVEMGFKNHPSVVEQPVEKLLRNRVHRVEKSDDPIFKK